MKTLLKCSLLTLIIFLFTSLSFYKQAYAVEVCDHVVLKRTVKKNKKNVFLVVSVVQNQYGKLGLSLGTAFVVNKNGVLATARHLFLGHRIITTYVVIPDGDSFFIRKPYFIRLHKTADVAIFKVKYKFKTQVKFSQAKSLESSDLFYYIGYPVIARHLLVPQKTVIGRFFGYKQTKYFFKRLNYRTQISVIPALGGASGSPLFDHRGRLVGVITFIVTPHKNAPNLTGSVPIQYLFDLLSKKSYLYVDFVIKSHK